MDIGKKLWDLGWKLSNIYTSLTPGQLMFLKAMYAAFHGLSSIGQVDDHVEQPRFCNLPDTMELGATVCKWPTSIITYTILQWPSQFTLAQMEKATEVAFNRWAAVCGIQPKYIPSYNGAMIVIGTRRIDGPSGVLAESELPCGNVSQCRQWYDTGENWKLFDGVGSGIDLARVMTHEIGHALGMSHIGSGNLMAPVYSQNIWMPQAGDISAMVNLYGPPVLTPAPQPPTPIGDYIVRFTNGILTVDGYRLTKLVEA